MAALKALRYMAVCHMKKGGTALIRPLHPRMQRAFLSYRKVPIRQSEKGEVYERVRKDL